MRLIRFLPLPALGTLAALGAHVGAEPLFDSPPLSEEELGQARGGFQLPNGISIDFGVLISTRLDGVPVLQTELRVAGDSVVRSVLAAQGQQLEIIGSGGQASVNGEGQTQVIVHHVAGQADTSGAQVQVGGLTFDADGNGGSADIGSVVADGSQAGASAQIGGLKVSAGRDHAQIEYASIKVPVGGGTTAPPPANAGAQANSGVSNPGNTVVSISDVGVLATAQLQDLLVRHAIGRQISSTIINTGNGRVVDNDLSINLRLEDVQPLALGSAGFRVQSLGLDAAMWRAAGG